MRQLYWDELMPSDVGRVRDWLTDNAVASGLDDVFWVILPDDLLTPEQVAEASSHPFCFAVELGRTDIRFEFLIRSRKVMRSPAAGYATQAQQRFIFRFADRLLEDLDVRT